MDKRVYRRAVCRYHSDKHGRIQTAHCEGDEVENLFDAAAACIAETDAEEKARGSIVVGAGVGAAGHRRAGAAVAAAAGVAARPAAAWLSFRRRTCRLDPRRRSH